MKLDITEIDKFSFTAVLLRIVVVVRLGMEVSRKEKSSFQSVTRTINTDRIDGL